MNYKSVYKLKHIMLTIYLQLCHNMLTVIQYYIIIKIKKTKASRKDLKKGKNMNQKKDYNMITKKLETELSSFHFDGLEISEITTSTSWMTLKINVLFIKDNVQITKVLYKDYQTGLWYYIKDKGMVISHKDTYNHTIKNLIDEMIYDVHFEIEETEETEQYTDMCEETNETENAASASGNDVFDGCKTVKDVMEVKQKLNARFGKEQYFDTDSLQEKIENINHCPNQDTCCIVSPLVHCNYNYKSDSCIKAHKNFSHHCEQVHKQMKAINNPNWHTVKLAIVNSNDFVRLTEKLKLYISAYRELKQTLSYLRKCKTINTYDSCYVRYIKKQNDMCAKGKFTNAMLNYIRAKLSMQNVESGVWASDCEHATGFHESRRYNKSRIDL